MVAIRARFLKVKCGDCGNEQVAFNRPATKVNCLVCGATLAQPSGGEATFKEIVATLD
ncbi:MAG: 30S ribosomal protein S27e [Halobacteriales archaeon]|jgi:small subunit ribosomal protein S27e|nr:30S ribosomal protein S27e [Halobacteriales archaeon]